MFQLGCLLIPLVLLATPIVVSRYASGWVVLLVVLGEFWLIGKLVPWLVRRRVSQLAEGLLGRQHDVLKGAAVHVHSVRRIVQPAIRPTLLEPDGTPIDAGLVEAIDGPRLELEVTITPTDHAKPRPWDFGAIALQPATPTLTPPELVSAEPIDVRPDPLGRPNVVSGKARIRLTYTLPLDATGRASLGYGPFSIGDFLIPA